jgi:hypothetical protein
MSASVSRRLVLADVLNVFEYEKVRDARRREIIALKQARRVAVGRYLSFVFENRATVLFQVQEMCRVERITEDARIQEELDVYNALLPQPGELSATLMIEIGSEAEIKPVLDRFQGIDVGEHVRLQVGRDHAVPGRFEAGRSDTERGKLSAVHFLRFPFPPAAVRAFAAGEEAWLVVDHPAERTRVGLGPETRRALLEDLTG